MAATATEFRKPGHVAKEEPQVLWQDKDIAVISKGAGWIVAISREIEQNKLLSSLLRSAGTRDFRDLVNSGKYEHLCHFVNLRFKDDKEFVLANSTDHEFGLAHRLDVDTSGALMLGKTVPGFNHLRQAFTSHQVFKEYICLVHGAVKKSTDEVNLPILWDESNNISSISDQGMWAKSIYTVLGRYRLMRGKNFFTLCRVVIITGRTHQIRIHMAATGHPLVGDNKYNKRQAQTDAMWCPRLFLHAWRIGFWDRMSQWHEVKAPLPRDLSRSLKTLEEIKLDLDNESNPSCRVVPSATAKELHPSPTSPSPSPPTPTIDKPPPPPPKAAAPTPKADKDSLSSVQLNKHTPDVNFGTGNSLPRQTATQDTLDLGPSPYPPPPPPPKHQRALAAVASPGGQRPLDESPKSGADLPSRDQNDRAAVRPAQKQPTPSMDQAQLEDLCCEVAKKALLGLPDHRCSVGQLGCMREVAPFLQQMGSKRPKLSKLLRDRPEVFAFSGAANAEQIVTLTQKALARLWEEEALEAEREKQAMSAHTKSWAELKPSSVAGRRTGAAPWSVEHESYEEHCAMLVDMGFERHNALRALRANHGDIVEAMHQLSMTSAAAPTKIVEKEPPRTWAPEAPKSWGPVDKKDGQVAAEDEEEMLRKALAISQQEEEDRKRRQDLEEEAMAAALAKSLQSGRKPDIPFALDEDDNQLQEALEQSRRLEDDFRRQEQLEEEEVECAIRESMRDYELFHARGQEALEETLRNSLEQEEHSPDAQWHLPWEDIQHAYNEACSSGTDLDEVRSGSASHGDGQLGCYDEDDIPPDKFFLVEEEPLEEEPPQYSSFSLQEWMRLRGRELAVDFDMDVLWMVLNEVGKEGFGDHDVLKMWLGFPAEEALPANLVQLISEFGRKQQLHSSGG